MSIILAGVGLCIGWYAAKFICGVANFLFLFAYGFVGESTGWW